MTASSNEIMVVQVCGVLPKVAGSEKLIVLSVHMSEFSA
jgi:hypothetical protein